MLISVQKYKLQYGTLSPILSTQITAPEKKISIHVYNSTTIFIPVPKHFFVLKFIFCTGIHIVVLLLYFSCFFFFFFLLQLLFLTEIYIFVLGYILLYCCIHEFYCTEEYSRTTDEYACSGTYVFVLRD